MTITARTDVFAVFGHPVIHSKSPALHNFLLNRYQYNGVYLAFDVTDIQKAIESVATLGIKGVSITIPFKTSVIEYLDKIDPEAQAIGAVNTIVNQNGRLTGYNTDYTAAIEPLKKFGIQHKTVCILGAGGAAHAIAYGIHKEGGRLFIANRTSEKGAILAGKFNGESIDLSRAGDIRPDILINTTSVGMFPDIDVMPVSPECLKKGMVVMDIVYNPIQTLLLKTAGQSGCTTIDGLTMFILQGASQFSLWTGITPDISQVRHYFSDQDR